MVKHADAFLDFVGGAVSAYHSAVQAEDALVANGFSQLNEGDAWALEAGSSYYVMRDGRSLLAWTMGTGDVREAGCRIVAAHTDSPALKIRPNPLFKFENLQMLSVDVYGGALPYTWLDRDLAVAGAVYLKGEGRRVVNLPDLKLRTTSLAIHLDPTLRTSGLKMNNHTHLNCILSTGDVNSFEALLASQIGCEADDILSHDLYLYDAMPPSYVGVDQDLISSARVDNVFSCYCLAASMNGDACGHTKVAAFFDAEEIGSLTASGARSPFLADILKRICDGSHAEFAQMVANSISVSVDMAHAVHPGYADRLDSEHAPQLNRGCAIKHSARAHYAMSYDVMADVKARAAAQNIPLQDFQYRADVGGGTSVGPLVTGGLGVPSIDIGAPMLAMHSIRELCGTHDVDYTRRLISAILA